MATITRKLRIVVVDDDPDDRMEARRLLSGIAGVEHVKLLDGGAELLDYLQHRDRGPAKAGARPTNLVLLDIRMPAKDGFETLEELKSDPSLANIPVIVLTGSDDSADADRALALGARSFLTKPLTAEQFLTTLTPGVRPLPT